MSAVWAAWSEDWILNDKVSFDGTLKVIYVHPEVTVLDIRTDVYTSWVDWVVLRDNLKYLPALRYTGFDPIGGGQYTGDSYFLINGWKLSVDLTKVKVTGVLYSDDYDTAYYSPDMVPQYPATVSSLVNTVSINGGVGTVTEVANAVWGATSSSYLTPGTTGADLNNAGKAGDPWSTSLSTYGTPGTAGYELFGQRQFQTDISTQVQSITPSSTGLHVSASNFNLIAGTVVSGTYSDTHTYNESEHYIRDNAGNIDFYYEFNIGLATKPTNFNFSGYVADKHEVLSVYAYDWGTSQYEKIGQVTGVNSVSNMSWALYTTHVNSSGIVRIRFASTVVSDLFAHVDQIYVGYIQNVVSADAIATQVRTELTPELTHVMQVPTTSSGLTPSQATMLLEMYELLGLDPTKPLVVTATTRSAGTINQHITTDSNSTVVNRV